MKVKIPAILLGVAPYFYWILVVVFLLTKGGLSLNSLIPIVISFVVICLIVELPSVIWVFCSGKRIAAKEYKKMGVILILLSIPWWVIGVIVCIAMISTVLLTVLVPFVLIANVIFSIPGIIFWGLGKIRKSFER